MERKSSSGFFTYARASMMVHQFSRAASKALIVRAKILDCSGARQFFMPPAFFPGKSVNPILQTCRSSSMHEPAISPFNRLKESVIQHVG